MKNSSVKNGKIEFMRFAFCLCVIFFHCQDMLKIEPFQIGAVTFSFFGKGTIGVEFFFVVSGFLMAKSIYKTNEMNSVKTGAVPDTASNEQAAARPNENLGLDTAKFIWHKYCSILPYHILVFVPIWLQTVYLKGDKGIDLIMRVLDTIPGFLLIQKLGFNYNNINSFEWYISAMLIAMFLLYPICRKYYSMFVHVIAPLGGLYLCGYLTYTYGTMTGASRWIGFTFACVVRAIAEISLGTVAFEGARVLSGKKITTKMRMGLTVLEVLGYVWTFLYAVSQLKGKYEVYALLLLVVSVMLSFSTLTYGNQFFNRRFFYKLGEFSLPMYLSQMIAFNIVKPYFGHYPKKIQVLFVLVITAVAAVICKLLGDSIVKMSRARRAARQAVDHCAI